MLCCLHKSFYKKCPKNHDFAKHEKTTTYEKETQTQVVSCEYCETFKNSFFHRIPLGTASWPTTEA